MLGSKPACTKDPSYMSACCTLNHTERPPDDVVRKFGEEVQTQAAASFDLGSKVRVPSKNSPYVASKWDVKITLLNETPPCLSVLRPLKNDR
ncbi:hypothetical protein AVEN_190096-1 [Araneus ventricosus]|uniref:Uncharacterized protein n=1 Tax=Araneus ventricosus TaxID=182803 RepID=A0A4Y2W8T6_ARAVE|nr:hypothetical protein AVEN_190096-1 [Araneus ventricosus]